MTAVCGTFPSASTAEEQRPRARAVVGFVLLAGGVVVQLVALAVGEAWLLAVAAGAIAAGLLGGRWLADGPLWSRLTRRPPSVIASFARRARRGPPRPAGRG